MRENDGRRLDHHTLEQMRLRAVDAIESGVHPEDVAASLGMARGTVYGWLAKYREGGKDALKARPVPGRPPKLTGPQMRTLYTMIVGADPRQYAFEFALWTRDTVRSLIRREFGVALSGKNRLGMKELRRRFCDKGWRFAYNGVIFTGASSVSVKRYRYRGSTIPTPWTLKPATTSC